MAGNDPHVHGAGNVHGPQEVGHEAPRIDARIHDQGAAAARVGRGGGSTIPTADGLQLSELDDEAPSVHLAALIDSGVDALADTRRAVTTRLRELDGRIDRMEQHLHEAIHDGRTRDAEARAVELTALLRERAEGVEELERLGADPPLDPPHDGWVDGADEREAAAPAPASADPGLAAFIERELEQSQSPDAGRGLGDSLVAACRPKGLDPLLLLAVAAHESGYGRQGQRWFGVGRPHASLERQIDEAVAALREAGGESPRDHLERAQQRGWSQEPQWADAVLVHHERLASAWRGAR